MAYTPGNVFIRERSELLSLRVHGWNQRTFMLRGVSLEQEAVFYMFTVITEARNVYHIVLNIRIEANADRDNQRG